MSDLCIDQSGKRNNGKDLGLSFAGMKSILHTAESRGHANHGWLNSHHSFSFAGYHNPERMHFGVLRVLNDDHVAPGKGFPSHPHDNMEIISIPLSGDLVHQDSMGNKAVIRQGDIQVMSAGTGIVHSEYNGNADAPVDFLQIWVFPRSRGVEPRYDQKPIEEQDNALTQILSPNPDDEGVWVHQDAWFHMGRLDSGNRLEYRLKGEENGVYAFLLEGEAEAAGQTLNKRDAVAISETEAFAIKASKEARILLMEVPMALPRLA